MNNQNKDFVICQLNSSVHFNLLQHFPNRHEAMADLIALMNSLTDVKGKIQVPGIMDDVAPVTAEEDKLYEKIDFDSVCVYLIEKLIFICG